MLDILGHFPNFFVRWKAIVGFRDGVTVGIFVSRQGYVALTLLSETKMQGQLDLCYYPERLEDIRKECLEIILVQAKTLTALISKFSDFFL